MRWTSTGVRIAARVETVGQAAAREVPLLNPLPGNAFRAAAALPCRVDATGEDRGGPAVVLHGAGPALRPPGAGSRWALTGSTSGVARHTRSLHKGGENLELDHYLEVHVPHRRPGCVGRGHRPGQRPGDRRVHRWAPTVLGTPHAARPGPRRHQGADRGAAGGTAPCPTRGGARRDRRSGGPRRPCDPRPWSRSRWPVDTWTVGGPPRWSRTCLRRPGSMTGRYPPGRGTTTLLQAPA